MALSALIFIIVAILLIALPFAAGISLPKHTEATRVELIKAPVDQVWTALNDLSQQTQWRQDLESIQLKDDDLGLRWIETPRHGPNMTIRRLEEVPQKKLITQMSVSSQILGEQESKLKEVPGGTHATFIQRFAQKNPALRFFSLFRPSLDTRLQKYVEQLKDYCEQAD